MNARIFTAATIVALSCSALPAKAADSRLLKLVMPDAKVIAGVNVTQAKISPFGQYVLSQIAPQDQELQKLSTQVGFDPRNDVNELLVASTGPQAGKVQSGLVMALGNFNISSIVSAATAAGAKTETYNKVTILEDPNLTSGIAFLNSNVVVLGDMANVKAAIDRKDSPSVLPASLITQVTRWSGQEDAWLVSILPPASLALPPGAPQVSTLTNQTAFQAVQQVAGGVKFGETVAVDAEAQTDTPDNAKSIQGVLQLLANMAALQTSQSPQAASLLKSLVVNASGVFVTVRMSLPTEQIQQLVQHAKPAATAAPARRPARRM